MGRGHADGAAASGDAHASISVFGALGRFEEPGADRAPGRPRLLSIAA